MRVCVQISTGKLLEMQSDATPGTLLANAAVAWPGIPANDIEERAVDAAGYAAILAAQPLPPAPQAADMTAACVAGITAPPAPQFTFDLRRAFIAKAISDEAYRLGVAPGALTGAQLTALRTRLANIYAAL